MHMAGYAHVGIDATYELLETPPDGFASIEAALRNGTLNGVNVTMPHKGNAFAAVDTVDESVGRLGAVNTIMVTHGRLTGFNTDTNGVLHAIAHLRLPPDTPVHILGSGGAAATAITAAAATRQVSVSARNEQHVTDLLRRIDTDATVYPWGTWPESTIVVNATPLGMHGEHLPEGLLKVAAGLVDMPYGDGATPAVMAAQSRDIPYADGLVMLVGQAVEAFHLFTGHSVPADAMDAAARSIPPEPWGK
jgi:shikimate dehydrogenase